MTNNDGVDTFTGDKVVNVSAYKGNIGQLAKQGCQFRVMISAPLDTQARERLAEASTDVAEKTLDRMDGALFMLPDGYVRILYAVMPYTDAETKTINDALDSWRERREHLAAATKHFEEHFGQHASSQSGDAVGMDIGDGPEDEAAMAAAAAAAEEAAFSAKAASAAGPDYGHEGGEDEAELALAAQLAEEREQMRQLEEAEAAAAAAAAAQDRNAEKKKRSRASPAPSGEKTGSQGKKKSSKTQN